MKKKRLYTNHGHEPLPAPLRAWETVTEVRFSQDPRDIGYMMENVPCQDACPVYTNIPGYIRCVYEGRYGRSYELNRTYNILPGVLGRICSRPCETACRHGESDLGEPVNICYLKRAAADLKLPGHRIREDFFAPSGKSVAVIGAGPAGLGAAHELTTLGHKVTVFESLERPGGMLMCGIPEFRLPREILEVEIDNILRLGVDLQCGTHVGSDVMLKDLLNGYDSVLLTAGCMKPNRLNVPGEDFEGVYSGLDFMMRANAGKPLSVGERVVVIGDGFTAMDCSRTAVRLGATAVSANIRMTEEFMNIDEHEKFEVKYEKIKINGLVLTKRIIGKNDKVEAIEFERARLEYDSSPPGRKPVPIPNSAFTVPVDTVISAIGQQSMVREIHPKIRLDGSRIWTRKGSYRTNINRLYAAGDCASGASDVITAISNGRKAAHELDETFVGRKRKAVLVRFEPANQTDRKRDYDFIPPVKMPTLEQKTRLKAFENEVELGYDADSASEEAKRCYLCHLKYDIDINRCIYCFACIEVAPRDCIKMISDVEMNSDGSFGDYIETRDWKQIAAIAIDNKRCIRCGKCYEVCPMECISISKVELIEQDMEM